MLSQSRLCVWIIGLLVVFTYLLASASEPQWWTNQKASCGLPQNLAYNDWVRSGSPCNRGNGGNANDNGAADRARAEAAEAKRQRDSKLEQQRIEAENKRAEEIASQARFEQEKREAIGQLKGISNGGDSDSGLKGAGSTDSGLKDVSGSGESTRLKTLPDRLAESQRLQEEDTRLSKQIDITIGAVRRMHFDRRAEDYEAWMKLSKDSQKELVMVVEKEATAWIASKAQDKMLETFKRFDEQKAERLIGWLEENARKHDSPPPVEIIRVLRRLSTVESKGRIAYDAKYVLKAIDGIVAGMDIKDLQQGLPILLDCVCDLVAKNASLEKHCELFRSVSAVTVAALYNNVTRRVAIHEVEQLNRMTEVDLRTLDNYNKELKQLMTKRNQVRQQIHMLSPS